MRVWDAETLECVEVISGSGDVGAIAAGASSGLAWRAIGRDQEIVIEPTDGGEPVAWFSIPLFLITTHPNGRTWAGAAGNHVDIFTLEDVPNPPDQDNDTNEAQPN